MPVLGLVVSHPSGLMSNSGKCWILLQSVLCLCPQVEDFPPAWRARQCIINCWICFTVLMILLCPMGLVGALLAFISSGLYVCRCCRPTAKVAGKKASKIIFIMALITAIADLAMEIILVVLGVLYLSLDCKGEDGQDLPEEICDLRKVFGLLLLGSALVLFLHLIFSLSVFISMRNCHLSINKWVVNSYSSPCVCMYRYCEQDHCSPSPQTPQCSAISSPQSCLQKAV